MSFEKFCMLICNFKGLRMQTLRKKDRAKGQSEAKGGGKEGGKAKAEGFCAFLDGQLM